MARTLLLLALVMLVPFFSACSSAPPKPQPTESVLRLYKGPVLPPAQIAILKTAPEAMRRDGKAFVTVELAGIDGKRFRQPGGWGNGDYEVHLAPGTYELQLRYRAVRPSGAGNADLEELMIEDAATFSLVAQPGHVYWLSGSLLEETASTAQWVPVIFDKAERMAVKRTDAPDRSALLSPI